MLLPKKQEVVQLKSNKTIKQERTKKGCKILQPFLI